MVNMGSAAMNRSDCEARGRLLLEVLRGPRERKSLVFGVRFDIRYP